MRTARKTRAAFAHPTAATPASAVMKAGINYAANGREYAALLDSGFAR